MGTSVKKIMIIEILMLSVIAFNFFVPNILNNISLIVFLGLTLTVLIYYFGIELRAQINEKRIMITTITYVIIYLFVIYLLGLIVGFNKTVYSISWVNLTVNILPTLIVIIFSEMIRYILIKRSNNKYIMISTAIVFILLEWTVNFNLYNVSNIYELRDLFGMVLLPAAAKNIFLTMSLIKTGYINNIVYRVMTEIYIYIAPIVPAFSAYVNALLLIILPLVLGIILIYSTRSKILKVSDKKYEVLKRVVLGMIIFATLIVIMLNSGLFKYQTLTVGSNSMKDYMSKGDIIIVEKLKESEKDNIEKGDILVFEYKGNLIAHRVNNIFKDGYNIYFEMKGDNNSLVDSNLVLKKDVQGILKFRIKWIGLPSILLRDFME